MVLPLVYLILIISYLQHAIQSGHLPGSHSPKAALIRDQKNVVTGAFGRLQEVEPLSHSVLEEDYK